MRRIALLGLAAALIAAAPAGQGDSQRAWRNLGMILKGYLAFGALSPEERAEVTIAAEQMRREAATAGLTPYEKCRLANLTTTPPSKLEEATINLKCSQR